MPPWDIPNLMAAPTRRPDHATQGVRYSNVQPPKEAPRSATVPSVQPSSTSDDLAQTTEMLGGLVNLLGEVVSDAVGDGFTQAIIHIEQVHAQDRDSLARNFEAALDRQEARFREALERQAENFAAAIVRQAELQAENIRAILQESLAGRSAAPDAESVSAHTVAPSRTAEVLEDLQETLRIGFGEVRAALDRHHRELMEVAWAATRPLAKTTPPQHAPPPAATPSPAHARMQALDDPLEHPPVTHLRVAPHAAPTQSPAPAMRPRIPTANEAGDNPEQTEGSDSQAPPDRPGSRDSEDDGPKGQTR